MRVRFVQKANQKDIDRSPVTNYLPNLYQNFPYVNEIMEIYILRDIIIHNHLWEMEFTWENNGISVTTAKNRSTGDTKYSQSVDVNTRQTKVLGLTVNPIKVGKLQVTSILQAVWKILLFLEQQDRNQCYVSAAHSRYKGKMVRFGEVIGMSETCT